MDVAGQLLLSIARFASRVVLRLLHLILLAFAGFGADGQEQMRLSGVEPGYPGDRARRASGVGLAWVEEQTRSGCHPDLRDWQGNTSLLIAAREGSGTLVRRLLDAGAAVETIDYQHHMTPLMWAALRGHADVAQLLLDAGADPAPYDRYGKTAAMLAREHGRPEIVALLEQ